MKMKQVYESNPALGDPMSIQGQLTENGHRLDKLRSDLKKFQVCSTYLVLYCIVHQVNLVNDIEDLYNMFKIYSEGCGKQKIYDI